MVQLHFIYLQFNIMVSSNREARVADFGVSHACADSVSGLASTLNPTRMKGTIRWMAKELFDVLNESDVVGIPNKESDVWSFGMVVYVRSHCKGLLDHCNICFVRRNCYPGVFHTRR